MKEKIIINQFIKKSNIFFSKNNLIKNDFDISYFSDASVKEKHTFFGGYGVQNQTLLVSYRKKSFSMDNNLAELLSIENMIILATQMNQKKLELFTDSLPSINFLKLKKSNNKSIQTVIESILNTLQSFEDYQIIWIPRHRNSLADLMAKEDFNMIF